MTRAAVNDILHRIDSLAPRDRRALERELTSRAEADWAVLAGQARADARARRITQSTIDRAVAQVRYGGK
jgi:hypothetical protein